MIKDRIIIRYTIRDCYAYLICFYIDSRKKFKFATPFLCKINIEKTV